MKKFTFLMMILGGLLVMGCGSQNADACRRGNLQACNAACDAGDKQACAKQAQLAVMKCLKEGDLKVCANMCLMAKVGKQAYCAKQKELCGKAENKGKEQCAAVE